ncbi:MAG: hypothetical protein GY810_05480 [Aureispira sp.]|nr:hypothetical protein [Aureispira sp.]
MKKVMFLFIAVLAFQNISFAQLVGNRLQVGQVYTFESESAPGYFISYGGEGRAGLNAANRNFKVVAPLNGKGGFVSLQAVDLAGENYLVMAEGCPRPYTASNYYNITVKSASTDNTFNENASFEVLAGNSNRENAELVSFRVKNGTHFFKREQGVFMDAPGGGVAPRYQNHFTFKITSIMTTTLTCEGQEYSVDSDKKIWQKINGNWTHVGDRCAELVCNRRHLFCKSTDGSMWRYNGQAHNWTQANTLLAGQELKGGDGTLGDQHLAAANGKHFLYMAGNGDISIYTHNPGVSLTWNSKTFPGANTVLKMQTDGNLVAYAANGSVVWASNTHFTQDPKYKEAKYMPVKLILEDDGVAVLYSATGFKVWDTKKGKYELK